MLKSFRLRFNSDIRRRIFGQEDEEGWSGEGTGQTQESGAPPAQEEPSAKKPKTDVPQSIVDQAAAIVSDSLSLAEAALVKTKKGPKYAAARPQPPRSRSRSQSYHGGSEGSAADEEDDHN